MRDSSQRFRPTLTNAEEEQEARTLELPLREGGAAEEAEAEAEEAAEEPGDHHSEDSGAPWGRISSVGGRGGGKEGEGVVGGHSAVK